MKTYKTIEREVAAFTYDYNMNALDVLRKLGFTTDDHLPEVAEFNGTLEVEWPDGNLMIQMGDYIVTDDRGFIKVMNPMDFHFMFDEMEDDDDCLARL